MTSVSPIPLRRISVVNMTVRLNSYLSGSEDFFIVGLPHCILQVVMFNVCL